VLPRRRPASAQGFTYIRSGRSRGTAHNNDGQMLVQAVEVDYDYK